MAITWLKQRNIFLTAILICAIVISILLVNHAMHGSHANNQTPKVSSPDSFMKNVQYRQFNEQGTLSSRLTADDITHFIDNDTALIQNPKLIYLTEDNYRWEFSGDHAKSIQSSSQIDLYDNVKIEKINLLTKQNEITITTTQATAYPKKKYAVTQQPVKIVQPDSVVNSVGMSANLATGQIDLFSDTQGVYQNEPDEANEKK